MKTCQGPVANPIDVILWDFNGTVLDDLDVSIRLGNGLLRARGLPEMDRRRYLNIFTFPVMAYYRAMGLDLAREDFADIAQEYIRAYTPASLEAPLRGETLWAIGEAARRGIRNVLLSASKRDLLIGQLRHFGIERLFERVLGLGDIYAGGKVDVARAWLRESAADPARVTLVGDTLHDSEVAEALGCGCVLLEGGHQSAERLRASGYAVYTDARTWFLSVIS